MFPKIFKYDTELLRKYSQLMWRLSCNSDLFGNPKNFSFKSRSKYAFKHPVKFIKNLFINFDSVVELVKAWYMWRQVPLTKIRTSKYRFNTWYL